MGFRPDPEKLDPHLESRLIENKGFWVDKPTLTAPLINKLQELHTVEMPKRDNYQGDFRSLKMEFYSKIKSRLNTFI